MGVNFRHTLNIVTILYSRFQLAIKYVRYYLTAANGKGHGIHSPFVFDFIQHVLGDKKKYACYPLIETARQELLQQSAIIDVEDFGAGSTLLKSNKRVISEIAGSSLKPAKYAQLLFRIVQYYSPQHILELGTSFGITSSYLAAGNNNSTVFTGEGSSAIAAIAMQTFTRLQIKNIDVTTGDFKTTLPTILEKIKTIDLAFIDANHHKAPTLEYFEKILLQSNKATIIIIDDIHWSREMEAAWTIIQQHPKVTLSIDLFFIGIVFFNPDINHKQQFTIRF